MKREHIFRMYGSLQNQRKIWVTRPSQQEPGHHGDVLAPILIQFPWDTTITMIQLLILFASPLLRLKVLVRGQFWLDKPWITWSTRRLPGCNTVIYSSTKTTEWKGIAFQRKGGDTSLKERENDSGGKTNGWPLH